MLAKQLKKFQTYFNGLKSSSFHFGDVLDSSGTLTFDLSNTKIKANGFCLHFHYNMDVSH